MLRFNLDFWRKNAFFNCVIWNVIYLQLPYKAAFFTRIYTFGIVIVKERYIFCSVQQSVKVIGINCIFFCIKWKFELLFQIISDKRSIRLSGGKNTFVYRGNDYVFKIQNTGFQNAHRSEERREGK